MRRIRILAGVGLLLTLATFVVSGRLRVEWLLPGNWFARIEGGTFDVGYVVDPYVQPVWSVIVERSYYPSLGGVSWRPFRAAGSAGSAIVIPLWQPLLLLAGIFAYAHGYLRGCRRSDPTRCADCGYALRGLPQTDGLRICPECGRRQAVPAAPALIPSGEA